MDDPHYQCRLEQVRPEGRAETFGWIPERGAFPGAIVELKGEAGRWVVYAVDKDNPMPKAALVAKQVVDRKGLPSIA